MTTRDFIRKNFTVVAGDTRHCSSVIADSHGNIYSYGPHYPLLFTAGGLKFRNVRGYSATTGKHIGWAWDLADYDIIWPAGRDIRYYDDKQRLETIAEVLLADIEGRTMDILKHRNGTSVQEYRIDVVNSRTEALYAVRAKLAELANSKKGEVHAQ